MQNAMRSSVNPIAKTVLSIGLPKNSGKISFDATDFIGINLYILSSCFKLRRSNQLAYDSTYRIDINNFLS